MKIGLLHPPDEHLLDAFDLELLPFNNLFLFFFDLIPGEWPISFFFFRNLFIYLFEHMIRHVTHICLIEYIYFNLPTVSNDREKTFELIFFFCFCLLHSQWDMLGVNSFQGVLAAINPSQVSVHVKREQDTPAKVLSRH